MNPFGFLFPPACPICGTVLKKTEKKVCLTCRRKLSEARVAEPACARCGKPLEEIETEYCVDCEKKRRRKYDFLRQGTSVVGLYGFAQGSNGVVQIRRLL